MVVISCARFGLGYSGVDQESWLRTKPPLPSALGSSTLSQRDPSGLPHHHPYSAQTFPAVTPRVGGGAGITLPAKRAAAKSRVNNFSTPC